MTTRKLSLSTDNFDRVNTFGIVVGNSKRYGEKVVTGSLHVGYNTKDDGILWVMQHCAVIASSYSADEVAERERLNSEQPVRNGDVVEFDGVLYRVDVTGDYSDCAKLTAI